MNSEETRSFVLDELRANKLGVHFHPLRPSDTSPKYDRTTVVFGGGRWGRNDEAMRNLSALVGKIREMISNFN